MIRLLNWLQCRLFGHMDACTISVFTERTPIDTWLQRHSHACLVCKRISMNTIQPLTPSTRAILTDMGLEPEEQRDFYLMN